MDPAPLEVEASAKKESQPQADSTTELDTYHLADFDDDNYSFCTDKTFSTTGGVDVIGGILPENKLKDRCTKWSGSIVTDRRFKRAIVACILINAVLLGVATFEFIAENDFRKNLFHGLAVFFLVLATIELTLKLAYYQFHFFRHGWFIFDMVVVTVSWFLPQLLVIRTFRIVRTLRLATRIPDLPRLVKALLKVIPKMFVIAFLLSILFYIFSVVFTTLFQDLYREGYTSEDYFSRLDRSWFTLFQIMTLDGWSGVTKEIMTAHQWAWIPCVTFVIMSSFFFLNLIIAVVCEAVTSVQHEYYMSAIVDSKPSVPSADLKRLEEKVEELTAMVETLVRMQSMQSRERSYMSGAQSEPGMVLRDEPVVDAWHPHSEHGGETHSMM